MKRKLYNILAFFGAILMFAVVSTSDYYTMELIQNEPSYLWNMLTVGLLMMIPSVISNLKEEIKGRKHNVHR